LAAGTSSPGPGVHVVTLGSGRAVAGGVPGRVLVGAGPVGDVRVGGRVVADRLLQAPAAAAIASPRVARREIV